ncbi:glutathione peroxidase [Jeotgalibaca porci]|uniref:glutathione peroxidase n=6 Tax=Jeotgalibaca porci TaxID=1868793 RepID=UPI0035A13E2F
MNIYDISVTMENGEAYQLDRYKGKTLLIVNTATKCGLAPQFDELQKLYDKYKAEDFVILGFPSNQFKQEVATAEDAAEACRMTYGVSFPMHEIVKINGKDAHPLFKMLTDETKGVLGSAIKWNFTKFLVDKKGQVVERFGPTESPLTFENKIAAAL